MGPTVFNLSEGVDAEATDQIFIVGIFFYGIRPPFEMSLAVKILYPEKTI